MANFFEAWAGMTKPQAVVAADSDGIASLPVPATGVGVFGLWGGDGSGNWPVVKVYRGSTVVNEGAKPAVTVKPILEDAANWTRVYQATGLRPGDELYGMTVAGQRYTTALTVVQVSGKASDAMADWARQLKADPAYLPSAQGLCRIATPCLALAKGKQTPIALRDEFVGGPLSAVHGLAIHTTGAGGWRDAFDTAIYGCINTWHTNRDDPAQGFLASTHFAISSDGEIVQIIPTNRQAFAQGEPGDRSWISVEIDNDGRSAMTPAELEAAKRLFGWVCATYAVPRKLSLGTLYFQKGQPPWKQAHDDITTKACADGGSTTTTAPFSAAMTRGLSCHYWLDARNGKVCPGAGILAQLPEIAKP